MLNPNFDTDQNELAVEQISVDRARRYLNSPSHKLDEVTVSLMLRSLDRRQAHLNRAKQRLSWTTK